MFQLISQKDNQKELIEIMKDLQYHLLIFSNYLYIYILLFINNK